VQRVDPCDGGYAGTAAPDPHCGFEAPGPNSAVFTWCGNEVHSALAEVLFSFAVSFAVLFRQHPPLSSFMLSSKTLQCWIQIGNTALEEYDVMEENIKGRPVVHCWIASQAGAVSFHFVLCPISQTHLLLFVRTSRFIARILVRERGQRPRGRLFSTELILGQLA
jgi:hypothetical protein